MNIVITGGFLKIEDINIHSVDTCSLFPKLSLSTGYGYCQLTSSLSQWLKMGYKKITKILVFFISIAFLLLTTPLAYSQEPDVATQCVNFKDWEDRQTVASTFETLIPPITTLFSFICQTGTVAAAVWAKLLIPLR